MTLADDLARRLGELSRGDWDGQVLAAARLRLFDHLACFTEGASTNQALEVAAALAFARPNTITAQDALVQTVASVRCTEADDIHLRSLTTPGAVVVPAALMAAAAAGDGGVAGVVVLRAIAAGYEAMTRWALGIHGPEAHYHGIWSTYFTAPVAAAAAAATVVGLDVEQTAHAMAIALVRSTGVSVEAGPGPGARWFALGCAARDGYDAARAAAAGLVGDAKAAETALPRATAADLDPAAFWSDSDTWQVTATDSKPFRVNRQSLAALESFLAIAAGRDPDNLASVAAYVPQQVLPSVARPGVPHDRWSPGLPYAIALAALDPDARYDVHRAPVRDSADLRALLERVSVAADPLLTERFPEHWGGRVEVTWRDGSVRCHETCDVSGSAARPLGWDELRAKHERICRFSRSSRGTFHIAEGDWLADLHAMCNSFGDGPHAPGLPELLAAVPGWPLRGQSAETGSNFSMRGSASADAVPPRSDTGVTPAT